MPCLCVLSCGFALTDIWVWELDLTIQASRKSNEDEKDQKGNYISRERYAGTCSRSFYVGEDVQQNEIHAKFEDGILKLTVPKVDQKKVEEKKYISIEG